MTYLLLLYLNYSCTRLPKPLGISDKAIQTYLEKRDRKAYTTRSFYDVIRRLKKKNHNKFPLSRWLTLQDDKLVLNSLYDIEILTNFLWHSDPAKNPFLNHSEDIDINVDVESLIQWHIDKGMSFVAHSVDSKNVHTIVQFDNKNISQGKTMRKQYKKIFNFLSFLNSLKGITLLNKEEEGKDRDERVCWHNQYVLERITNANFIITLYSYAKENSGIVEILFEELKQWIQFPLLTTRLRLLERVFTQSQIHTFHVKDLSWLANVLRTIRLYHLQTLLPSLAQASHYMMACLKKPSSNTEVSLLQKRMRPADVDTYLRAYFSSIPAMFQTSNPFLYFDPQQTLLVPIAWKNYTYIDNTLPHNIHVWKKEDIKAVSEYSIPLYRIINSEGDEWASSSNQSQLS